MHNLSLEQAFFGIRQSQICEGVPATNVYVAVNISYSFFFPWMTMLRFSLWQFMLLWL
jgi:hypothetical protein